MLPTVLEETEEDLLTPDQVESSSQPNCNFKSGQSFSASSSNCIVSYPLDITDLIKEYNHKHPLSYSKPSVSILLGDFGSNILTLRQLLKMGEVLKSNEYEMACANGMGGPSVIALHQLLKMREVLKSNEFEIASSNGQQMDGSSSQSPSLSEMGTAGAKGREDCAVSNGVLSSEKVAADTNTDGRDGDQSNSRNRKDSESGRSVGEENERRNSGNGGRRNYRNGGNNRNGGNRNNARRQREKKWWVCPDPACRTRNSIEATGCNNCGLIQEKRGGRPPYARNWEKTRVTGMSITHVSSPTVVYGQTQQQQIDYARLRNCMAQAYAESSYRPSLVAAKMLLGVKIGEGYERVRTEERLDQTPDVEASTQGAEGEQEDKQSPADTTAALPSSPEKRSGTPPPSAPGLECPVHSSPVRDSTTSSSGSRWRVQLVDRGSWSAVLEADLHFLLAGLSDLAPLAAKYTLNELRLKRDSTEQQMEQSRLWLEEQTKDAKVDCDVYRQTKDGSSVLYLDMYKGDTLLNRAICELGGVEPKTNLRWLKPSSRVSTSSVEEGGASPPPRDGRTSRRGTHSSNPDGGDLSDSNNDAVANEAKDTAPKEQRPPRREADARQSSESRSVLDGISVSGDVRVAAADPEGFPSNTRARAAKDGRDRSSSTATGNSNKDGSSTRRGGWWSNRRRQSREPQQRLPPLQDWAVLCFDPRTAQSALRSVCEQVERADRDGGRAPATAPDSIRQEGCEEEASMVAVLADTIASHPRLLLLLCVLPQHLKDYSGLERTGRSLGVCVVCIRGESLVDFDPSAASRLLKDLQSALLNSPAILPYQGFSNASNTSNNDDNNNRRRENRNRRNQNKRRGSATRGRSDSAGGGGRATSPRDGSVVSDPRLQAVIGAASQGISLLQKLSQQPGGQLAESALSPGMKSLLQSPAAHQDIAKALQSLEDLQVSYKQARTYTHEAFQAAGSFFSHLSNAITPPVTAAE